MDKQHERRLAYLCAILNAMSIGFSFLFVKLALKQVSPIDLLTYRFAASFAVMSIPVLFGLVKIQYHGKPLHKVLLLATMYPLGFFLFQTFGLEYATSAEGGILYAFTPVVTMLLASIFLKETTTIFQKLSIFLSVFGVVFIFIMKGSSINLSNMTGIFLLLLSCMAIAGYSVLARSLLKAFHTVEITYLMLGIGFVVFLVISLSKHTISGTLGSLFSPLSSGTLLFSILYLGIMASLVSALTTNYALSKIEASKVSVFSNLSTIISMAAGAVFLGEDLSINHVIGSMMIIIGVTGTNLLERKERVTSSNGYGELEEGSLKRK